MKNNEEFSGKSSGEWTSRPKRDKTKRNRIRQKNKRVDSQVESTDTPEIPDRGETSYPQPPLGRWGREEGGKVIIKNPVHFILHAIDHHSKHLASYLLNSYMSSATHSHFRMIKHCFRSQLLQVHAAIF